jgi:hypothetical protein
MQALKVLVIGMGLVVVVGVAVVAVKLGQLGGEEKPPESVRVTLGSGCRVAEMDAVANRLALRLDGVGCPAAVLLVDPRTGAVVGNIGVAP